MGGGAEGKKRGKEEEIIENRAVISDERISKRIIRSLISKIILLFER